MNNRLAINLWLGLCLGSLFFYPVTSTLNDEPYYMMWNPRHSAEVVCSWVIIAILSAFCLRSCRNNAQERSHFTLFLLVISIPFTSFLLHFSRQAKLYEKVQISSLATSAYCIASVLALLLAAVASHPSCGTWRERITGLLTTALLVMSPLTILSAMTLTQHGYPDKASPAAKAASPGGTTEEITLFILFDEMSFDFLYKKGTGDIDPAFPNIRKFAEQADNYHEAESPGTDTLMAMPGILTGRSDLKTYIKGSEIYYSENGKSRPLRDSERNIFMAARNKGFRTVMCGNYHDYSKFFSNGPEQTTSFSLYNYATINDRFSLLNPVRTTIGMWPYLNPPGLLKRPVFALQQRDCVEKTSACFSDTIRRPGPAFAFFHFSIPHVPFVFNRDGFHYRNDCFVHNRKNYLDQLTYVDRLFGTMMDQVRAEKKYQKALIVLLSDHNYRDLTSRERWSHIPLIIKNPGQDKRRDFNNPVKAVAIINRLL